MQHISTACNANEWKNKHKIHCTKNHIFFFQMFWKDGLSSHWNMTWIALGYDTSCTTSWKMIFFFPENMILFYRRKMKDDLSQENTWKHDIFFKCSEKIAFPKKITPEHELSRTIRKDGISFSRKYDIFSRRKVKDDLSQKIRGNMMFSVYSVKMVPLFPTNMKLTFQKPIKKSKIVFSRKKNT